MKLLFVLCSLTLLSVVVLLSGSRHTADVAPPSSACLVSATQCDIDDDIILESVEILLVDGWLYNDEIGWCGMGEKWEGRFDIQVRKGATVLSRQSLNDLMGLKTAFFLTPRFQLVLHDYNHDGRVDFNLGQYAACNWYTYYLFTIAPDGRIARLDGAEGLISAHDNSTDQILLRDGRVGFQFYTQDDPAYAVDWYVWNRNAFELVERSYSDVQQEL